jgi:hypothetical protein
MKMKHSFSLVILLFFLFNSCFCQEKANSEVRILFHGIVMDASTLYPVSNAQILINRAFSSVSGTNGTFAFYVNRKDTVLFKHLGFKSTSMFVSDTLAGLEFVAGIYMQTDTLLIGEVVIVPRLTNLKSEMMRPPRRIPSTFENARYNVAISAYQARNTQNRLGDPETNYNLLRQKQKVDAYEKGGVPSDMIAGINPLLLLPAAYLLLHGYPEKPAPFEQNLTEQELNQIHKKYLESLKQPK